MCGRTERYYVALALERLRDSVNTASRRPLTPQEVESGLDISVVFTSVDATLAALKQAGSLANRLGAHITLVVAQIVPTHLPLDSPPVLIDWNEKRFRTIASDSPVQTAVQIYLCRDRWETLSSVLKPHSLVVVGGKKKMVADGRKSFGKQTAKSRSRSGFYGNGVSSHARFILCRDRLPGFAFVLGLYQSLRQALRGEIWITSLPVSHRWDCSRT